MNTFSLGSVFREVLTLADLDFSVASVCRTMTLILFLAFPCVSIDDFLVAALLFLFASLRQIFHIYFQKSLKIFWLFLLNIFVQLSPLGYLLVTVSVYFVCLFTCLFHHISHLWFILTDFSKKWSIVKEIRLIKHLPLHTPIVSVFLLTLGFICLFFINQGALEIRISSCSLLVYDTCWLTSALYCDSLGAGFGFDCS